jgi:hypothetical protein
LTEAFTASASAEEDSQGRVEFNQTTTEDRMGPFFRVYLDFLVRRVVHDLGNSISGINSLSDYHLRSGITDPGLEESLLLIRESAEQSRELLVAVGDLLQPAEPEEELVEVQTLVEEAAKMLSLLLPRSVKLETTGLERNNSVISVLRGDFLRKILALVAMDLGGLRVPSGTIRLSCAREGESVRVVYRSIIGSASKLRERAPELLKNLSSGTEVEGSVEGDAFVLTMTFPLVELFEEER